MEYLEYKGFQGSVRFHAEDRTFHGRVLGVDDVVSFEGSSVDELEAAFRDAVDDYVELCHKTGREPERRYSGRIPLRIDPDLHRRVAAAAAAQHSSVNSWIAQELQVRTSAGPKPRTERSIAARKKKSPGARDSNVKMAAKRKFSISQRRTKS
jgi:predicted HicB family RNase H-like nuclease